MEGVTGNDRCQSRGQGRGRYNRALGTPKHVEVLASRDRLESWKEIAAFLNRSERTVRRWEDHEGLPVHRLAHDKRGSVYAYTWEIERWRESRRQLIETDTAGAGQPHSIMSGRWRWVVVGAVVVLTASAATLWWLRPAPTRVRTPNPEAVRLVELANFAGNAGRVQVETGTRYFQDAIRLDPGYGPAWAGLAVAHFVSTWFGETPIRDVAPRATSEAEQALRLDPSLSLPWQVLAGVSHFYDWDHSTAEARFRKAIELNPKSGAALSWRGDFYMDLRRFDEARMSYTLAQQASPRWLEPIAFAGNVHLFSGNPDMAIVEYKRVLESEPNYGLGIHYLGRAYIVKGQYDEGITQLRKSNEIMGNVPFSMGDLGYGLARAGRRAEAEAILADLIGRTKQGYYPAFAIAVIQLGLGHTDEALDWLERAAEERNLGFYMPSADPAYDSIRTHPRYKAVMERANLPH